MKLFCINFHISVVFIWAMTVIDSSLTGSKARRLFGKILRPAFDIDESSLPS